MTRQALHLLFPEWLWGQEGGYHHFVLDSAGAFQGQVPSLALCELSPGCPSCRGLGCFLSSLFVQAGVRTKVLLGCGHGGGIT